MERILRVHFLDGPALFRRTLTAMRAAFVPLAFLPLARSWQPEDGRFWVAFLAAFVALGTSLGAIGLVWAQRVGAFEGGVFAAVRRQLTIRARTGPGPEGAPQLVVDGNAIPRDALRAVTILRREKDLGLYSVDGPTQYDVCLALRGQLLWIETIPDLAHARALATALASALDVSIGPVAVHRRPFAAAGDALLLPMLPLLVDVLLVTVIGVASTMAARGGRLPWMWTVGTLAMPVADWVMLRWLVLGPSRREAERAAQAALKAE